MKSLSSLLIDKQQIDVPYFDESMPGFVVTLSYVSRDTLKKIRNSSKITKFNRSTHKPEESIDEDLFQKLYCDAAIAGWTGLKISYLAELTLIDIEKLDEDELDTELEYSKENAYDLISTSPSFDTFVAEVMKDFSFFSKKYSKMTKSL